MNTSNGANLRRGETSSYPPFASSSAVRAVYAVRAVRCFVTLLSVVMAAGTKCRYQDEEDFTIETVTKTDE